MTDRRKQGEKRCLPTLPGGRHNNYTVYEKFCYNKKKMKKKRIDLEKTCRHQLKIYQPFFKLINSFAIMWESDLFKLYNFNSKSTRLKFYLRPTLKIFLFPLTRPCFTCMDRLVGKLIFSTSQIGYPLNLIVYSKTCLKRPLNKRQKIGCFSKTVDRIMQVKSIAECYQEAFCNTFDLHLALILSNDLCCVYLWVAVLGRFYCIVLL